MAQTTRPLRVCSYEDRPVAMDSLILMGESLCRADPDVSLHLTVPDAPASVRAWAAKRPQVILSTTQPEGVTGWDVKPWLLQRELDAGAPEAVWLDDDMIVTRALSPLLNEFPRDSLIVAQEWNGAEAPPFYQFWGMPMGRTMPMINACLVRVTPVHRPLLERYFAMTQHPRYRELQARPLAQRPDAAIGDTNLLVALLESQEFSHVPFDYLRLGSQIVQCAGSSGYRPGQRILDLFRGLPALFHGIGRKPWDLRDERGIERYLLDLATDVSPYVLTARQVARSLDMHPAWMSPRTSLGAIFRGVTANHPALAGLPLAVLHAIHTTIAPPTRIVENPQ